MPPQNSGVIWWVNASTYNSIGEHQKLSVPEKVCPFRLRSVGITARHNAFLEEAHTNQSHLKTVGGGDRCTKDGQNDLDSGETDGHGQTVSQQRLPSPQLCRAAD